MAQSKAGQLSAAQQQAQWARLLLSSFADAGVRDVVVSPGSRSTPFVLAAAAHPKLECHSVVDERSAAFFALGQARIHGRPSLLLCTSGSAAANYFPAVVEAAAFHIPLLVLTADRPVELAHCGANQTIDQIKLYGDHARYFFDLGLADTQESALRAARRTVAQAAFRSAWPEPGPVHLNARARKPLEPGAGNHSEPELVQRVDRLLARPLATASTPLLPAGSAVEAIAERIARSPRGLIVAGPGPLSQRACAQRVAELSRRTGYPVYAEAASQLRFRTSDADADSDSEGLFVDTLDSLLASSEMPAAELVLQIGRAPTSGSWGRYLTGLDARHIVLAEHGWQDAESTASQLLFGQLDSSLDALLEQLPELAADSPRDWTRFWSMVANAAAEERDELLAAQVDLSEAAVVQQGVNSLADGDLLIVGNSLAIRHLDSWCGGDGRDLWVVSQRGASGIDGLVSGAVGSALVAGRPALALLGDLSLLHDLAALGLVRRLQLPFVILVINNDGGRIFEQLPIAQSASLGSAFDLWSTPHGMDFRQAASQFSIPYRLADTVNALEQALRQARATGGSWLIEAAVPPQGAAALNQELKRSLKHRLRELEL